ncbi:MAG: hypothetical protein V9H69_28120 [Anaerolineae bacterium]
MRPPIYQSTNVPIYRSSRRTNLPIYPPQRRTNLPIYQLLIYPSPHETPHLPGQALLVAQLFQDLAGRRGCGG